MIFVCRAIHCDRLELLSWMSNEVQLDTYLQLTISALVTQCMLPFNELLLFAV